MDEDILRRMSILKVEEFVKKYMKDYTDKPYHNFSHVKEVHDDALFLAHGEGLNDRQKFLLRTAALTHDLINNFGSSVSEKDEELTAAFVSDILPGFDYSSSDIRVISDIILATKMSRKPRGILEKIIKDADIANVGKPSFMEKGELIRKELGLAENLEWYVSQKKFLDEHCFYTDTAQRHWGSQKEKNKFLVSEKISGFYK